MPLLGDFEGTIVDDFNEVIEVDEDVIEQVTTDLNNALCDLLVNGPNEADVHRVMCEIDNAISLLRNLKA